MRFAPAAFLTALLLSTAPALATPEHYDFDKAHTNIVFYISHMGFSEMVGRFSDFNGTLTLDMDKPEESKVDVTIKPASVKTSSDQLNEHLQDDKFFNTAKFPDMHFVSKSVKVTAAGGSGKDAHDLADVTGDLTLLGVTKPVVLHVRLNKADYNPMTNNFEAGFTAEGTLKRSDFGMSAYVPMVGDDVRIFISTEAINTDRAKQQSPAKH